eukprot:g13148.t1
MIQVSVFGFPSTSCSRPLRVQRQIPQPVFFQSLRRPASSGRRPGRNSCPAPLVGVVASGIAARSPKSPNVSRSRFGTRVILLRPHYGCLEATKSFWVSASEF